MSPFQSAPIEGRERRNKERLFTEKIDICWTKVESTKMMEQYLTRCNNKSKIKLLHSYYVDVDVDSVILHFGNDNVVIN